MRGEFYRLNGFLAVCVVNQMSAFWLRLINLGCFWLRLINLGSESISKDIDGRDKNHIRPGSVIYSDSWKGYNHAELVEAGFSHFMVNYRFNFVDPDWCKHSKN